jgi:hypothetical protein
MSYKDYRGNIVHRVQRPSIWYKGNKIEVADGEFVIGRKKDIRYNYWYVLPLHILAADPEASSILKNKRKTYRNVEPISGFFLKEYKSD